MLRSVRITGIFAALASSRIGSQPDSTTGENAITSTFCAIYERIALIWFSCFCWASENLRVIFVAAAVDLIDSVLAVRHALSAPTCAKPRVMGLSWAYAPGAARLRAPIPAVSASAHNARHI